MLTIRLAPRRATAGILALPVSADGGLLVTDGLTADLLAEAQELLRTATDPGKAGAVQDMPRPLRKPVRLLLIGVGAGGEADWRTAGAALARRNDTESRTIAIPADSDPAAVRGLAEGLLMASYRFLQRTTPAPKRGIVTIAVDDSDRYATVLEQAQATAAATALARDLTNMPSSVKNPAWFVKQVDKAIAGRPSLSMTVRGPKELETEGFGGIMAVGRGSATPPRLLELSWKPRGAKLHIVLVGKGITFDTGGVSIKPADSMKLMKKDMGGAAAVTAALLGAAELRLPVRITAVVPLAENAVSGDSYRPGDIVTHYDGKTSEITNTDAEGRIVLADALGYAVAKLKPDYLINLATLTGANAVALGKMAALYSDNDDLAGEFATAADAAGEKLWRMPLHPEYVEYLSSSLADLYACPEQGGGSITAALYLREFTGDLRDRFLHIDMSSPSWSEADKAELTKGATGWGVRTLLRWLATIN